jgi:hypothetical protein
MLTAARNLRASAAGVYMGTSKEPRTLDDAVLWVSSAGRVGWQVFA